METIIGALTGFLLAIIFIAVVLIVTYVFSEKAPSIQTKTKPVEPTIQRNETDYVSTSELDKMFDSLLESIMRSDKLSKIDKEIKMQLESDLQERAIDIFLYDLDAKLEEIGKLKDFKSIARDNRTMVEYCNNSIPNFREFLNITFKNIKQKIGY